MEISKCEICKLTGKNKKGTYGIVIISHINDSTLVEKQICWSCLHKKLKLDGCYSRIKSKIKG